MADECVVCTNENVEMVAVAPCRHVNMCTVCYAEAKAKDSVHAHKCSVCQFEPAPGCGNLIDPGQ